MALRLYNTLTRRVEEFTPLEPGRVTMYTCGPTVYDRAHIGNFRTFLAEDILRRFLEWKGLQVLQVRNLTDVDDRTIHAAVQRGISLQELTAPFIAAFFEDHDRLGLERAEHYPRATDYVPQMVDMVRRLVERGLAYEMEGSVYFDISEFPDYGRLAQLENIELREGERETGDTAYDREDARDFVLWKGGARPEEGDVAVWDSPWGPGRPGWHLECSVMATAYLGQPFDIHSGGVDLIFPHHTNEIAQAEGAAGKPFARYWMHVKHAMLDGRKMSKSLNHFFTLDDLLERGYRPSAIRRLLTSGHYRTEINFTLAGLDDAARSVERLLEFRRRLQESRVDADVPASRLPELARQALAQWEAALDDDLNLAEAWGALFTFVREANAELDRQGGRAAAADSDAALQVLDSTDGVFGVLERAEGEKGEIEDETRRWVEEQVALRAQARAQRDFARADAIRDALAEAGIEVEDTPTGPRWRRLP
jgi:cysteinyl-tRNA synthetase